VCDLETPRMRRPRPALGRSAPPPKKSINRDFYLKVAVSSIFVRVFAFCLYSPKTDLWMWLNTAFGYFLLRNFKLIIHKQFWCYRPEVPAEYV
jgi:hypothetical protein